MDSAASEGVEAGRGLVRGLLRAQHPDLADLPLRRLGTGWDNLVLRLGADLVVRLPKHAMGARLAAVERRWLPVLAPRLPLPVPVVVRVGQPGSGYPWPWGIHRFVPGGPVGATPMTGTRGSRCADALAAFLMALHEPAPPDAPRSPYRGVPLAARHASVEAALAALPADQSHALCRLWSAACAVPAHRSADVWLHGDLHGLNVLARRGALSGVIDFGDLCAGDPATDLAAAWMLLDGAGRARLRSALALDEDVWERGRGWALFLGLMLYVHGRSGNETALGSRTLAVVAC